MANEIEKTVQEPATRAARGRDRELTRQDERFATPPVDIYEKEDALTVLADLPGVGPDGLAIRVEQGVLTIEGRVGATDTGALIGQEFELISFYRQFRIAETIDTEKIRASLKNGVLQLTLPKVERAKPRQIPVETD